MKSQIFEYEKEYIHTVTWHIYICYIYTYTLNCRNNLASLVTMYDPSVDLMICTENWRLSRTFAFSPAVCPLPTVRGIVASLDSALPEHRITRPIWGYLHYWDICRPVWIRYRLFVAAHELRRFPNTEKASSICQHACVQGSIDALYWKRICLIFVAKGPWLISLQQWLKSVLFVLIKRAEASTWLPLF